MDQHDCKLEMATANLQLLCAVLLLFSLIAGRDTQFIQRCLCDSSQCVL